MLSSFPEILTAQAKKKADTGKLSNCTFMLADAETVEFRADTFDLILCSSGMLYLQEIAWAIKSFHGWLKPGGRLCFNTPQVHFYHQFLQACTVLRSPVRVLVPYMQEPCVPATELFYTALEEVAGIKLADAAAPLANPDVIRATCLDAGFPRVAVSNFRPLSTNLADRLGIFI